MPPQSLTALRHYIAVSWSSRGALLKHNCCDEIYDSILCCRLSNVKHAMQRHFCSVCQRVFCHQHTAYSPHGPLGSCGMESQCICEDCHFILPVSTQVQSLQPSSVSPLQRACCIMQSSDTCVKQQRGTCGYLPQLFKIRSCSVLHQTLFAKSPTGL